MDVFKDINWRVRLLNPTWWFAMVPAVCLVVQTVMRLFGLDWDYADISEKLIAIIDAAFALLVLVGVNTDVTTSWLKDSARAMGYLWPAPNVAEKPIVTLEQGEED